MAKTPQIILFVAECATLAHMARPTVLAKSLDPSEYEIVFASNGTYDHLFEPLPFRREQITSIGSAQFLQKLARGQPLYDTKTLLNYVAEDLALFDRIKPDIVVGDFRLSLSVSARIARVPYVTISNIYWSPFARQYYPVPELPITRILGVPLAQMMFNIVRPLAFAQHTRPLNAVRKHFGMRSLGLDLRRVYTDADLILYADTPGLVKTEALPCNHHYIGPVFWSPDVPVPDWWDKLDRAKPIIYLTPGSSGSAYKLPILAAALASLPATVMVATAGRVLPSIDIPGVYTADFLPGAQAAERSDLVVCNGGSPTTAQALAAGTPILGMPINLDQYLNMSAVANAGLGLLLRGERTNRERPLAAASLILNDKGFRKRALAMQEAMAKTSSTRSFQQALRDLGSSVQTS